MDRINDQLVPPPSDDWRFRLPPTALLRGDGVDHRYAEARHSNIAKTSRSNSDWRKFVSSPLRQKMSAGCLTASTAGTLFLEQLYLTARFQRQGIGSDAVRALIEEATRA